MQIINVDAETFEAMLSKFENFASRMETLCRLHGNRDMKELKDIAYKQYKTLSFGNSVVKIRINHIGQIVSVGEY